MELRKACTKNKCVKEIYEPVSGHNHGVHKHSSHENSSEIDHEKQNKSHL